MRLTSQSFTQDLHCCGVGNKDPELTMTVHDGGGGPYLVMDAVEWAMDSTDILLLAETLRQLLVAAEKANEDQHGNLP